ncbi:MAG TPA: DUF2384 domain-containing protein [Paracoccaceae bacterium]|nr:DUF2384 domain-containing protein [Paracoccaceae bacterium]HMO71586.1 DUF2384 domain-containing protein [Paracoccaceae bacterium]
MHPARTEPAAARIAGLLGLDRADQMTDLDLAVTVGEGLGVEAFDSLEQAFGGASDIRSVVSEPTLRRARQARRPLSREHSERLYELGRVLDAALRAYGDDRARAEAFLMRPHPLLRGQRPFDVAITSSAGADAVVGLIGRAAAGVAL